MFASLSVVMLAAVLGVSSAEGPTTRPADVARQGGKVVANRSALPEGAQMLLPEPPAPGAEDRVVERRPARDASKGGATAGTARMGGLTGQGGWMDRIRGLVPLLLVLMLIGGLAVAARRLLPSQWRRSFGGQGVIEVLARQQLSPRQSVVLLKVGRRVVLVGLAPDRVTSLDTIVDPDEVALIVGRSAGMKAGSALSAFQQDVLREASAYQPAEGPDAAEDGTAPTASGGEPSYLAARQELRGLLSRVRSLAGSR